MASKYGKIHHRRAFELWHEQGESMRDIAARDDMPSLETVHRWSRGDIQCDCGYHNWDKKRKELVNQAREEVKEEMDLPDEVEREKNQLKLIYRTQKQIEELLKSGELPEPKSMEEAIKLLKELNDEKRKIKGEAQSVTEIKGAGHQELNLQKIAKQLNIGDPNELIEAVEESTLEGDVVE